MAVRIAGTGSYVPQRTVTNDDLAGLVETSDEWIRSRTGICERHILESGEGTSSMAGKAAKQALAMAKMPADDIDLIIMGTSSADQNFPSGACEVQAMIGADRATAFDISAACSGFLFAMSTAAALIQAGGYKKALVIGADSLSRLTDWSDRGTCVLFGDGAGAAVLEEIENSDSEKRGMILRTLMGSDGKKGPVLACNARGMGSPFDKEKITPGFITMDGQEVFRFAVRKVPEIISTLLEKEKLKAEDISFYVLHQANQRILEAIAKKLDQSIDKFPMNLDKYGNTSAASVPVLLDELFREGRIRPGDKIVLAGFGAGLTWGATVICM